jgi:hypothetical protein
MHFLMLGSLLLDLGEVARWALSLIVKAKVRACSCSPRGLQPTGLQPTGLQPTGLQPTGL